MPLPDDPDPAPVPNPQEAWETPGSSQETAMVVGGGAIVGALALVGLAPYVLPLVGYPEGVPALHVALTVAGGIGAAIGAYAAWRFLGKT